jgi:DNA repair exonuclease SbcCD nuclease subunit
MKKKRNPDCLLTSDWHIRGDRPICRTDDYANAQWDKIKFILDTANEYNCPILIAGDIGHRPHWGDKLLNQTIDLFQRKDVSAIAIVGQHDLPNHRLNKWEEGSVGILNKALGNSNYYSFEILRGDFRCFRGRHRIYPSHYSTKLYSPVDLKEKSLREFHNSRTIALAHQMVIKSQDDKLWEAQKANHAKGLLRKFPCYDLIVCGDNHQSFVVEHERRLLVNPGSIMRMSANQIDFKPRVYLWYAETNEVEAVYLPIEKDVFDTSHLTENKERDTRIESFVVCR